MDITIGIEEDSDKSLDEIRNNHIDSMIDTLKFKQDVFNHHLSLEEKIKFLAGMYFKSELDRLEDIKNNVR